MSNGIGTRQNEDKSIAMLAAQRQLYNEVGRLDFLNFVLLVLLPLVFAILQELGTPWSWIRYLSYGLSLAMVVISILLTKKSKIKRMTATSIQMAFDTYVYNMPWDKKLFGKQKNLNSEIVEKSKIILDNEEKRNALLDWYTPVVDKLELNNGILACQKENYHWDGGLRKRYRIIAVAVIVIVSILIFSVGIVKNEQVQELITRFIFILPMMRWLFNLINGLNEDLERLKELDAEFTSTNTRTMGQLQMIQKSIDVHRKNAVKIPNLLYKVYKDNDEDSEHRIATIDAERI